MAVLWQLGVEFIQGYFIHEPEEVVPESRPLGVSTLVLDFEPVHLAIVA